MIWGMFKRRGSEQASCAQENESSPEPGLVGVAPAPLAMPGSGRGTAGLPLANAGLM